MKKIKKSVQQVLDEKRYEHTLGVMYTAGALAMRYHAELEKTLLAGLLHDCAKCISSNDKIQYCNNRGIHISESELKNPGLLHAKVGAYIANDKYGISDSAVLDAITYHTTGRPAMTLLDKIIYVADYIEPNRNEAPNLSQIRSLAFENIDECLYTILESSLGYLKTKNDVIDPKTEQTYLYYKKYLGK